MSKGRHIKRKAKLPRHCPRCGGVELYSSPEAMWCGQCPWTEVR